MNPTHAPSPNHDERGLPVSLIVLHYTGMRTGAEALDRLRDPASGVSAHYLVEEDGRVFALVDEDRRAWHAGVAMWAGQDRINARSVGVEIVNPGHEWGYRDFPTVQMEAVRALTGRVARRHAVPPSRVVGHADVAPHRKEDPGERFDWDALAAHGLALPRWDGTGEPVSGERALRELELIGYPVAAYGNAACTVAFQRRFAPGELGQGLNEATRRAISWAARRIAEDALRRARATTQHGPPPRTR